MAHWGWYWKIKKKHIPRTLCSELPTVDSFKLYKSNAMAGFIVNPCAVKATRYSDHLKITYRNRKSHSYLILVEKLSCNYGGYRYYFKCPLCQKRMRILYFAEKSLFLCRRCLNLSYEIQRLRPTKRFKYMSEKVEKYIESKKGDLDYKKPKYMHKSKYQILKDKQFYYESESHEAFKNELRQQYGARIEPYLDDFLMLI